MSDQFEFPSLDDFISQTQSADLEPAQTKKPEQTQESMIFPTIVADSLDINKRKQLGTAYAELYIAAQGLCQETSNMVCDMAQSKKADKWFSYGFNERMSQSAFAVRLF